MVKRKLVQLCTAILYNGNLKGFRDGSIWQQQPKSVCVPGLNCYSCPGALGSCPLGSLQSSFAGTALSFPFYVLGLLLLFGLLVRRIICGWLCPFGFIQELLHKLPLPKLHKNKTTLALTKLKYIIGIIFVIILPMVYFFIDGVGSPAFCKFICPAGTLEAGLPLLLMDETLRAGIGWLFGWKFLILLLVLLGSGMLYRPFCRFLCPLGAWYGLFNKLSVFGIIVDEHKCIHCDACVRHCQMDCTKVNDRECINCGECIKVCPTDAISFKFKKFKE